jgi:hypothetical protein
MRETDTATDAALDDDDDGPLCSWCAELRHDFDAALPFCNRCLGERLPTEMLWRIATTALSALEERARRVLVAAAGVPPRP